MIFWLSGCLYISSSQLEDRLDPDNDGYGWPEDCNSDDRNINPGEDEECGDHIDNNCDVLPNDCAVQVPSNAWQIIDSEFSTSHLGGDLEVLENFSGSGHPDVVILGVNIDAPSYSSVFLHNDFSKEGAVLIEDLSPSNISENSGISVLGNIGDLNRDGYTDLGLGTPTFNNDYGSFGVALGPSGLDLSSVFEHFNLISRAGSVVSTGGFVVSAYEYPSVIVTAPAALGGIVLLKKWVGENDGGDSGLRGELRWIMSNSLNVAPYTNFELGTSADIGDSNGDGIDDIYLGAPGTSSNGDASGAIFSIHGPIEEISGSENALYVEESGQEIVGRAAGDRLGGSLDGGVDVDGDGYDDVLAVADQGFVGIFQRGYVALIKGGLDGLDPESVVYIEGTSDDNGRNIKAIFTESLVGAEAPSIVISQPEFDNLSENTGAVWGFWAAPTADSSFDDSQLKILGEEEGAQFGRSIASGGDLNGDGWTDIVVGAPFANNSRGAVYLLDAGY